MKYKVIKRYRDLNLKKVLTIGEQVEIKDNQRAQQLIDLGIIQKKRGRKSERKAKKKY